MDTPAQAWHYTTAEGLLGIVTNNRLWATSAAYMNDRDEIRAGREALNQALNERQPELETWQVDQLAAMGIHNDPTPMEVFLLSAALDGDLLTLWRSYGAGGEAEYAIELDPMIPLWPVRQSEANSHPEPAPPEWPEIEYVEAESGRFVEVYNPDDPSVDGSGWGKVEYLVDTSAAVQAELDSIIASLVKREDNRRYVMFSNYLIGLDPTIFFKQPGFDDEREVRATWRVDPWWRFVLYRSGRFGLAPYIEVAALKSGYPNGYPYSQGIANEEIGRLPIRSIRIGPTRAGDEAEQTLRAFLNAHGYGDVQILRSSTPYR